MSDVLCVALRHLVLGQKFASPVSVRNVVDGQAKIVVAIFEEQRLGIFEQNSAKTPLHVQHLLHRGRERPNLLGEEAQHFNTFHESSKMLK